MLLSVVLNNVVHVGQVASDIVSGSIRSHGPVSLVSIGSCSSYFPSLGRRWQPPLIDGQWYQVNELGIGNINKSVLVAAVFKKVSVVTSLLHGLCVKRIDILPVLSTGSVLVDEAED